MDVHNHDVKEQKSSFESKGFDPDKRVEPVPLKHGSDIVAHEKHTQNDLSGVNKENLDDNGTKYRETDHLLPNTQYELNGYKYETDNKGRIKSAEGKIRIKDPDYGRNMENVRKYKSQEYNPSDDRGHLIANQFGGSDRLGNVVPMDAKLNKSDYNRVENTLADAVKNGADVKLKVEPIYGNDSSRPSDFQVSYSIDGDKTVVVFKNKSEAKS